MKKIVLFFYTGICLLFISSNKQNIVYQKNGLIVYGVSESNEFKNAKLNELNISYASSVSECKINYSVDSFELKAESKNNLTGICANSKDGQHIHNIIDNKPYTAIYKPEYVFKLDSSPHLMLSFISRSHHQSIKNKNAYKLTELNPLGNQPKFNLKNQYLFYSRPKGIYVDNDTKEILLDFYLVNTNISSSGNKVKITIDSIETFYIKEWKPYLIKGLSIGEHKIKLDLVDKNLKSISNPFLPVTRSFSLQKSPELVK